MINNVYESAFTEELEKIGGGKISSKIISAVRPILEKMRIVKPKSKSAFEKVKDVGSNAASVISEEAKEYGRQFSNLGKGVANTEHDSKHLIEVIKSNPKAAIAAGGILAAGGGTAAMLGMRKKNDKH